MTLAEQLPAVIDDFVDTMFADFIIGFRFEGTDRARIKVHELELARKHLLGEGRYTGRAVGPLHRAQRINRGQFRRRLAILQTVCVRHGVQADVIQRWLDHDRKLEQVITDGTDCVS